MDDSDAGGGGGGRALGAVAEGDVPVGLGGAERVALPGAARLRPRHAQVHEVGACLTAV